MSAKNKLQVDQGTQALFDDISFGKRGSIFINLMNDDTKGGRRKNWQRALHSIVSPTMKQLNCYP